MLLYRGILTIILWKSTIRLIFRLGCKDLFGLSTEYRNYKTGKRNMDYIKNNKNNNNNFVIGIIVSIIINIILLSLLLLLKLNIIIKIIMK